MYQDGHRARLRDQLDNGGLDSFSDVQVLEYLLSFAIRRKDVKPLAYTLLEQFGSLARVLDAPPEVLQKIPGIGPHTAQLLSLMPQLFRRYSISRNPAAPLLDSTEAICRYIQPYFTGCNEEQVYLVCMDAKCKVLDCRKLSTGGMNSVSLNPRKVVETVLQQHATMVVLAHNHPWGYALPSREDELITRELQAALELVDVQLADHIIVCEDECVSMAASGLLRRY